MDFQFDGIERRLGKKTDAGHARRLNDMAFNFIFWALIVFLLGMIFGCASPRPEVKNPYRPQCNLPEYANDFACQPYVPDEGPELDDFEVIDE